MNSKKQSIASSGWNTYSGIVAVTPDEELDLAEIKALLKRVVDEIDNVPDRVRSNTAL
jgi:predicted metal-dependent enzyme (double-stranded beta helix superfamily)